MCSFVKVPTIRVKMTKIVMEIKISLGTWFPITTIINTSLREVGFGLVTRRVEFNPD